MHAKLVIVDNNIDILRVCRKGRLAGAYDCVLVYTNFRLGLLRRYHLVFCTY